MKQYRKASHCAYDLKYRIVWITKYRKPVLGKEIGTRVRDLNKAFWGRHLWGRGYFVSSTGNVTEEMIARYIEGQQDMERAEDADFKVEP